ncbi:hypothetical protein EV356DRAFT_532834 [Viridothelium virens]|uniref:DUF2406 domain-containing protein n=1 Tax=Viridothelium virens TaxID=1048519 RepID=A0A6A6H8Z9_VIRVR|nr:hypothetical protein EV356DRAFT_532834 [Viridothelium virens]
MEHQGHSRPRAKSGFSFRSNKSDSSSNSKPKVDLQETDADKRRWHMKEGTKANPNTAIDEAQPAAVANQRSTMDSVRSVEWKDSTGNVISDPDLSNPSRSRWERPLDTIRSFEAAIDGQHKKRQSIVRTESEGFNGFASHRSSYFGGYGNDQNNGRFSQAGGYYGSRTPASRPDSYYHDGYGAGPAPPAPPRHRYGQRLNSDPTLSRYNNPNQNPNPNPSHGVYPSHGYHQSYDTVNTGMSNGSESTGQWANSTDPSSENSSIDRVNPPSSKQEPQETYGLTGFGGAPNLQGPILEEYGTGSHGAAYPVPNVGRMPGQNVAGALPHQQQYYDAPPAVPPKASQGQGQRKLLKLNSGGETSPLQAGAAPDRSELSHSPSEKRKSWFKRRFSRD